MLQSHSHLFFFFFFNDTATTEISTLSLHDALPILLQLPDERVLASAPANHQNVHESPSGPLTLDASNVRSEEHTSELQSRLHLVCRLLLEKKKNTAAEHLAHNARFVDALPRS